MSDADTRLSAGEPLADLMPDLYYGVMAEVEEFLVRLLHQLQSTVEENMNNPIGLNNSPQPTTFRSPTK